MKIGRFQSNVLTPKAVCNIFLALSICYARNAAC